MICGAAEEAEAEEEEPDGHAEGDLARPEAEGR